MISLRGDPVEEHLDTGVLVGGVDLERTVLRPRTRRVDIRRRGYPSAAPRSRLGGCGRHARSPQDILNRANGVLTFGP
jgi:hypothetical protein